MLKEIGRHYELPLIGCAIRQIIYNGMIRLDFSGNQENIFLDFHGDFEVVNSGHSERFSPSRKEALLLFYGWFQEGVTVQEAKAEKRGQLFLKFSNRQELIVQDGPFENWHFTVLNSQFPHKNLFVHGGVGTTSY